MRQPRNFATDRCYHLVSVAQGLTPLVVTPMRKAGYIAQVGEANPHSPRLGYKITAKGRREIANG